MARPKNPRNTLLHAIERAAQPIYLLDAGNAIAYLNPACAKWLGVDGDALVGIRCQPSLVPLEDPLANRLRGLIPHALAAASGGEPQAAAPQAAACQAEVFALQADGSTSVHTALVFSLPPSALSPGTLSPSSVPDSDAGGPADAAASPMTLVQVLASHPAGRPQAADPNLGLVHELRNLVTELSALQPAVRDLPGVAGKHPLTWRLRKQLEAAGESRANLLLVGEEKSLPDLFARAICKELTERTASLPTVLNGRLADEDQVRETLTGLGRRSAAEKQPLTTLLIIRADQLPAAVQPLLRQWLQTQGSQVRTAATSPQSLLELADAGQFDLELAVRLSTQEIQLPRLMDRLSDLPAIAAHWLEQHQAARKAPPIKLSPAAVDQLLEFEWTGDLEQFRSVLLQAAAHLPEGGLLLPEHLPEVIRFGIQARRIGRPAELAINLDQYLEGIERLLLERALQQANQNKAQAARLLGLTRQRFLRRCEHLQLALPEEPIDFRPASDGPDDSGLTASDLNRGDDR